MSIIRILPERVASQIAAGEVIERPSSVVRELLDNSIDAGSDRITIRVEKGGKKGIRVSDNGAGMDRDDLLLCIERHATSKINSISDLFSIKTLGFRGEALPSISSVSKLEITSRPGDQLVGYKMRVEGGKLRSIDETGAPAGTIVEVRDLFYNVPARRRFLRTIKTETDHIIDTLSRVALPFNHIHFKLDDDQKTIMSLPASENELSRLSVLMGRRVAGSMIDIFQERGDFTLRGYLAPSDLSRARGDRIYVYINRRNVRDKLITRAIMEGYGQRLMKGRYPHVIIFIDIDPMMVDINVHPTKQEVRFRQGNQVYETIVSTINRCLIQKFHHFFDSGPLKTGEKEGIQPTQMVMAEPEWEYSGFTQIKAASNKIGLDQDEHISKEDLLIIGQLNDTYILCQVRDGLLIIDQHAAHERIVYETLKKSPLSSPTERQVFLIPYELELSLKDGRILQNNLEKLVQMGLEFEHFGGSTFLLRSVPPILLDVKWEEFLFDLVPALEDERGLDNEKAIDRLLTIMACHGAIRAGQRMSQEEMVNLVTRLKEMDLPTHCPHGRPVFKKFTFYEMEKMFKRVV